MSQIMTNPIKRFNHLHGEHLRKIASAFSLMHNNMKTIENIKNHRYRPHIAVPLCVSLVLVVDTIIVFNLNDYFRNPVRSLPVFTHVVVSFMPDFFRAQGDILFSGIHLSSILIYTSLLFDTFPHIKFIMLDLEKTGNSKVIYPYRKSQFAVVENDLARKLTQTHRKFDKWIGQLAKCIVYQADLAFFYPLWLTEIMKTYSSNGQYFPSLKVIFFGTVLPFYARYIVGTIHFGIRFLFLNYIINIKQNHFLSLMRGFRSPTYSKCRGTMAKLLDLTREIDTFNRFFSRYISIQVALFGLIGCSVLTAVLKKGSDAPFPLSVPWIFYACVYLFSIFLLNIFSSKTISLNMKLFKRLRQLQIRLLSKPESLNRPTIVKLDLVNEYKLLMQKCGFRLMNSSMINNKFFFFTIFPAISIFYMKLYFGNFLPEDFFQ